MLVAIMKALKTERWGGPGAKALTPEHEGKVSISVKSFLKKKKVGIERAFTKNCQVI